MNTVNETPVWLGAAGLATDFATDGEAKAGR
jgi:hypothetical protein